MLDNILTAVAPIIIEAVTTILALAAPVVVGQVAVLLRQKSRVEANREIDQLRGRVDEVIRNGARAAILAGADAAVPDTVDRVLTYVIEGAPQALSRLNATETILRTRIEAALASARS